MNKILKSFTYAINGILSCFTSETNFKIHVLAALIAIALGFVFNVSAIEWMAITFCMAFVIAMEMINTAVEKLCDVVYEGQHPKIKMVKDIAAGAVLIAAISSAIIGCIIFLPKIIEFVKAF